MNLQADAQYAIDHLSACHSDDCPEAVEHVTPIPGACTCGIISAVAGVRRLLAVATKKPPSVCTHVWPEKSELEGGEKCQCGDLVFDVSRGPLRLRGRPLRSVASSEDK